MPGTSDVIYLYDGSFEGLLCCVHESVYTHELPVDIQPEEAAQPTLFRASTIPFPGRSRPTRPLWCSAYF